MGPVNKMILPRECELYPGEVREALKDQEHFGARRTFQGDIGACHLGLLRFPGSSRAFSGIPGCQIEPLLGWWPPA